MQHSVPRGPTPQHHDVDACPLHRRSTRSRNQCPLHCMYVYWHAGSLMDRAHGVRAVLAASLLAAASCFSLAGPAYPTVCVEWHAGSLMARAHGVRAVRAAFFLAAASCFLEAAARRWLRSSEVSLITTTRLSSSKVSRAWGRQRVHRRQGSGRQGGRGCTDSRDQGLREAGVAQTTGLRA